MYKILERLHHNVHLKFTSVQIFIRKYLRSINILLLFCKRTEFFVINQNYLIKHSQIVS